MWRAVDSEGEVLDVLVQTKRNKAAALKLMRKLPKKYGSCRRLWSRTTTPPRALLGSGIGMAPADGEMTTRRIRINRPAAANRNRGEAETSARRVLPGDRRGARLCGARREPHPSGCLLRGRNRVSARLAGSGAGAVRAARRGRTRHRHRAGCRRLAAWRSQGRARGGRRTRLGLRAAYHHGVRCLSTRMGQAFDT
jgi:hypothetical protein